MNFWTAPIRFPAFAFSTNSVKISFKLAIEELFDVEVAKVNVINAKPRPRRVGRYAGYKNGFRKAIVTLKDDSKEITAFEM